MLTYFHWVTSEPGVAEPPVCSLGEPFTLVRFCAAEVEDGLPDLDLCVLYGRFELLCNLEGLSAHLPES